MVCQVLCRIVGLPYVGKSSFFNVLTKTRCCYLSVNFTLMIIFVQLRNR